MKKILTIITIFIFTIVLTGCNKYRTYTEVSYDEFQAKLENKDTFVIVMGSSICGACESYKITMDKVIKDEQVEIFYLDFNKLTEEQDSKIYSKFVVQKTPTTIFIKDGEETSTYDRLVGVYSYSDVIANLKKHGYIGE